MKPTLSLSFYFHFISRIFSLRTMSNLYLLFLLMVVVAALDPPRKDSHHIDRENTHEPHKHFTVPNVDIARPTMGTHGHHGRKDGRSRAGPNPFLAYKSWQQVKFLSDYQPKALNLVRKRREQIHQHSQWSKYWKANFFSKRNNTEICWIFLMIE